MKKKHNAYGNVYLRRFSVQSGYISNHKPYVTSFRHGIIGAISPAFAMNLEKINELTAQDMAGVNATILEQLNSDVQLINQLDITLLAAAENAFVR